MDIQLEKDISIGDFLQYTAENLIFPLDKQECTGAGADFWCADWWTIEVAKCLFIGNIRYLNDPIPKRLEGNKNFALQDGIKSADMKRNILTSLIELKDTCSSLFIPQIGRGIDLLLANLVKPWENVYCFDVVNYEQYLKGFFTNKIHFKPVAESGYDLNNIEEESIAIINEALIKSEPMEVLLKHDKITKIIHMGEIFGLSKQQNV